MKIDAVNVFDLELILFGPLLLELSFLWSAFL